MRVSLLFLLCVYPFISFEMPTVIKFYRPFGAVVNQLAPQIIASKQGVCSQQSKRILREEAWRCIADGVSYDPCFVKPGDTKNRQALCVHSPWQTDAVLVKTQSPLTNTPFTHLDMSTGYPWGVELTTGVSCLSTDKDKQIEGNTVHYDCTDNSVLFGYLQRCKEAWSLLQQASDGEITTVIIKKAWF